MNKEENIEMLKQVRKNTTDPAMQKDIDDKIKALTSNKTINK